MAARTAFEQLALELINRARLDPAGEAARFGITLNEGLAANTISATAKQPLAGNSALVDAARGHTQHMINTDLFDHDGIGDGDIGSRAIARGYTGFSTLGENISAFSGTNQAVTTVDIHRGLFVDSGIPGRGHRLNILSDNFREVGIGQLTGAFRFSPGGAEFQSTLQTQDFGTRGANFFITGVAFNDLDNDSFYDIGEARGSVTVTVKRAAVQTGTDITEAAGGYDIGVATITGSIVRFSGGGLAAPVDVTLAGAQANAKVDLIGTSKIASSVSATLGTGAKDLKLLGVAAMNGTGNTLANKIEGNKGANVLNGAAGNDTMTGGAGVDTFQFKTALGATNRDTITDFSAPQDVMHLENTGAGLFTLLAAGALNAQFFKANATGVATDANDRIVYNTTNGALFYDTNGNAAGGATQFATLQNKAAITAADFFVI